MILEACAGAFIIACIIAIIYMLTRSKDAISVEKAIEGGNLTLRLRANKDLKKTQVSARGEQGDINLVRGNLRKGDIVEFSMPLPKGSVRVVAEDDGGEHTVEISV
jgi:hypothetical protein